MDELVKVAEVRPINSKISKVIKEALENAGFVICSDSYYSDGVDDLIVMEKRSE